MNIVYVCTCGYVGFVALPRREDAAALLCRRCATRCDDFHGWGEVKMDNEEKINEFVRWVSFAEDASANKKEKREP